MEDLQTAAVCEPDQSTEVERVIALVMKAIEGDAPGLKGLSYNRPFSPPISAFSASLR